jgi:hypothetical protein
MTKYIGLLVLVMIAAAINAYRIDNSLVRAYDTLFGLAPLVYFVRYVLRRRGTLEVLDEKLNPRSLRSITDKLDG